MWMVNSVTVKNETYITSASGGKKPAPVIVFWLYVQIFRETHMHMLDCSLGRKRGEGNPWCSISVLSVFSHSMH